jgi:pimeloyl-ACP methyl ester carboxylesterase
VVRDVAQQVCAGDPQQVERLGERRVQGLTGTGREGRVPGELDLGPRGCVVEQTPSRQDSPVGLLAWILDKFAEWSDTEDRPFETISRDRVLDDVTLYWLTRTGASAARIYYESHNSLDPELRVDVPSAITMYPRDIEKCPRPWAQERYRQIVRWRSPDSGGHFPSLEVPEFFVKDLQEGLAAVLAASR